MRISASMRTVYPQTLDGGQIGRDLIELAAAASAAGMDGISVGDHHAQPQHSMQAVPLIARLMAEVGDMSVGALFLVPLYHPVLLAEMVSSVAVLAKGPFTMQATLGGVEAQFAALGATLKTRPSRMEEHLTIIRRLLDGETVTLNGRYHTLNEVAISPLPPYRIPIWVAASVPTGIERAARFGDAWIVNPSSPIGDVPGQVETYRAAAKLLGRTPAMVIRRDIYVGESDAEAEASTARDVADYRGGFRKEALIIGGPDTIVKRLRELHDLGFVEVMARNLVSEQELALASFRRLGAEVLPEIHRW